MEDKKTLNIIVCVKQVPDTTDVKIDPETNTLIREGVESIMNPFDRYAVEEGVLLKEKYGGRVTALSMGPPQAESVLREAIAMGADEGILLSDRAFAGSDTWATSYTIAKAIETIKGYNLIICGKQAADGDTAQVGPGISIHLDIPQVTYVKKISALKNGKITAERLIEEGYEVIEVSLPCLLTVVKEINEPRIPSLRGMMKAKKAEIKVLTVDDLDVKPEYLGLDGSPTQVMKIFSPPQREEGLIIEGEIPDIAEKLAQVIKEHN
ncbi:MAG: electron transfer flavoprotein subunit beta/FixA family protein [Candidatus Omnitrophica bacterium]|nr:electron transfer flavoprotein subunit beta/FixA family protein [Candidatus Omnitrophota bacterium]